MNIPEILNNPAFLDAPLKYKWDENTSGFYAVDAENNKLSVALWTLNHKATFGLVTALSEWIYWRLSRHITESSIIDIQQAHWASLIDKHYSFNWEFDDDYLSDPVHGPIWTALELFNTPRRYYYHGRFIINLKVDNMAMLARHISPDKKLFDHWLSSTLRKAAAFFPTQYDRADILANVKYYKSQSYDSSSEPIIPREFFFDPAYDYQTVDNAQLINQFLTGIDYKKNSYLNSPEKMIAAGFQGIPYHYKEA